jgi:hypothetical protein
MKKKLSKKLTLTAETLRTLNEEMVRVYGAYPPTRLFTQCGSCAVTLDGCGCATNEYETCWC